MQPEITSVTISPATVTVGGSYLVTVVAEDPILTIKKAQGMTLAEIQTVTLERMYEGS